jgi:uncharacterized membrane protein
MDFNFNRNDTTWIAAAAALAGGAAYMLSNRMHMGAHLSPTNDIVFEKTTEIGRMSPEKAIAGALTIALGGYLVSKLASRRQFSSSSESTVHEVIDVDVPVSTAYNQWTQFEEFPRFMATVEEVKQIDDSHLHWRAVVAGKVKEWDAEITEQIPDQRIAWRSTSGPKSWGEVSFEKIRENRTRVTMQMYYEPETADEKVGSALGGVKLTTKGNLKKFKSLIEKRGSATGAWRGEIPAQ